MPNRVVGDSDRDDDKSKKQKVLWKPKSEPVPNRNTEIAIFGYSGAVLPGCLKGWQLRNNYLFALAFD